MVKVIWAPSALNDIESIAEFIARDSIDQANLFVERLFEATDRLQDYQLSGRIIAKPQKTQRRKNFEIAVLIYRDNYRDELRFFISPRSSRRARRKTDEIAGASPDLSWILAITVGILLTQLSYCCFPGKTKLKFSVHFQNSVPWQDISIA